MFISLMWLKIYYDKLGLARGGCYEKKCACEIHCFLVKLPSAALVLNLTLACFDLKRALRFIVRNNI